MAKLDRLGWVVHGRFEIGGKRLSIRSTDERFGRWVDHALQRYRLEGPAEASDERFSVFIAGAGRELMARKRSFHVLYRRAVPVARTSDVSLIARALLAELEFFLLPEREDAIYLEAGLVSLERGNVLVPSGLIPLLGQATRRGAELGVRFASSLYTAVDPVTGRTVPLRPALEISGDAYRQVGAPVRPGPRIEDRPLVMVCMVDPDFEGSLREVSRAAMLQQMVGAIINLPRLGNRGIFGLKDLVDGARCYELAPAAPARILDLMHRALTGIDA